MRYAVFFVFLAVLLFTAPVYGFKQGSRDCLKCHKLSEKDMVPILDKINLTGAKVLGIQMSPIKGLWEVAVENKGQRFIVYLDFAKKYVTPGPLIDYASRKDVTRERTEKLNKERKVDISGLSLRNALVLGKADAAIKVVVFTDPG